MVFESALELAHGLIVHSTEFEDVLVCIALHHWLCWDRDSLVYEFECLWELWELGGDVEGLGVE